MTRRLKILTVLFLAEAFAVLYIIWYFTVFQSEAKTDLEYTSYESGGKEYVSNGDLLNNVFLLSGSEFLGSEPSYDNTSALPGPGNMMWFIRSAAVNRQDIQLTDLLNRSLLTETNKEKFLGGLQDGVLNFAYDFGQDGQISGVNWENVAVRKINASSLLSWQRNMDCVLLSSIENGLNGGISVFYPEHKDVIIICPEFSQNKLKEYFYMSGNFTPQLIMLQAGCREIVPGLWAIVSKVRVKLNESYIDSLELDLLTKNEKGEALLFVGAGHVNLEELLDTVNSKFHCTPKAAVMNFGSSSSINYEEFTEQMKHIAVKYTDMRIIACGDINVYVFNILSSVFGERLEAGRLMKRIPL
ncbi:hypothetical protein IJT93_08760 [bacterium]|nr:hypothetical protein [bacterium]